jgi:septal ring factor EnvC (AmiA/AmiB activator)
LILKIVWNPSRLPLGAIAIFAVALGAGEPALSPTPIDSADDRLAEEEAKMKLVSERLAGLTDELASLDQRQTSLIGELHRLEVEIGVARQQLELLKIQLDRGYREIDRNLKQIQSLEESIRELRPYLASRAVGLYKLGRLSYARLLLSVEEPRELTRAYRYISRLARVDTEKISRFLADQKALEQTKAELLAQTEKTLETRKELERTTRSLERRQSTKASLLEEIDQRREMAETMMFELEDARQKLGDLIAGLESGEADADAATTFLPILLFRGELDWPVAGRIGARFGKHKHPRFLTVTVQNGIEIEAPLGAPVRAFYDGRVVFASWFQGCGTLLILSHPHKVHSLYGHLSEINVEEGDTVRRGQEIALVGDTGSLRGPGLYFEVREEGQPVDPEQWLAELTQKRAAHTQAGTP